MKNKFLRQYGLISKNKFLAKKEVHHFTGMVIFAPGNLHKTLTGRCSLEKICPPPPHYPRKPFPGSCLFWSQISTRFHRNSSLYTQNSAASAGWLKGFPANNGKCMEIVFVRARPQCSHVTGSSTVRLHKLPRAHDVTAVAMRNADWVNERGKWTSFVVFQRRIKALSLGKGKSGGAGFFLFLSALMDEFRWFDGWRFEGLLITHKDTIKTALTATWGLAGCAHS